MDCKSSTQPGKPPSILDTIESHLITLGRVGSKYELSMKLGVISFHVDAGDTYPMTGLCRYRKRTDRKVFIDNLDGRVII